MMAISQLYPSQRPSLDLNFARAKTAAAVAGVPTGSTGTLYFGVWPGNPSSPATSRISPLTYYPTRLSDTILQSLTS